MLINYGIINGVIINGSTIDRVEIPANWLSTHYRCWLNDIELPLKSFQYRLNTRAYASAVIPGGDRYFDVLNGNINNGQLRIAKIFNYNDGSSQSVDVFVLTTDDLRLDEGGRSGMTATITARGRVTNTQPKTVVMESPTFYSSSRGASRRYRCRHDPRLNVGDTAQINDESFTVGEIVLYIDYNTAIVEISEAA